MFDVTSDEQVTAARRVVEETLENGRRFAGLFSNAGVAHYEGDTSSEGTPMGVLENVMDVNFFGSIRFIREFLPLARAARGTVVINSALMARTVLPFNAGYAASKCALEGWADSLRREVGVYGVRVILIEAAAISTGLTSENGDAVSADNPYPVQRPFLQKTFQRLEAIETTHGVPLVDSQRSLLTHCRRSTRERAITSVAEQAPSTRSGRCPMESRIGSSSIWCRPLRYETTEGTSCWSAAGGGPARQTGSEWRAGCYAARLIGDSVQATMN